jgi:hypothetical protein
MKTEIYLFDPRPEVSLVTTAKKFVISDQGLTLVFAHGNGLHKEQWEPTIDDLLKLLEGHEVEIREVTIFSIMLIIFSYEPTIDLVYRLA